MFKLLLSLFLVVSILNPKTIFAFETKAKQAFLIDADTKEVLLAKNADEKMAPSSMSKLMTILLVFERLDKGELSLTDKFTISEEAWKKQGSKMFVRVGDEVSVDDLLKGIIVQSGNDASIALAEALAGTEEDFATMMNEKAKLLGLKNSHFTNSTGWPDPNHYMTCEDLAVLAKYLIDQYQSFYPYFKMKEYTYNNIRQENRNVLLDVPNLGVDGLKTGNTDLAGYGIVASAKLNGRRLILVINGLESKSSRADEAKRLLTYGFTNFTNVILFKKDDVVEQAKVWLGKKDTIPLVINRDIIVTVPKHQENMVNVKLKYESPIKSPIKKGDYLADVEVYLGENLVNSFKIFASEDVEKLSLFRGLFRKFKYYIFK